jgi:putative DNA primase/helicase
MMDALPDAAEHKPWLTDPMYGGMSPTAAEHSWRAARRRRMQEANDERGSEAAGGDPSQRQQPEGAARPPAFTDEALALRFADLHRNDLRYVAAWGKWMIWDGRKWAADDTLAGFNHARAVCRAAAAECNKAKIASNLASAKTVAAVERLAKADRAIAATTTQWDENAWLLNTPAGVIDLRTGDRNAHSPADYLTSITAVSPHGACPIFHTFLRRITDGDRELQAFLQRVAGYALTGATSAHAMFFLYGTGGNGKGVFINAIAGILNDYHRTSPIETFTANSFAQHPTDLAGLRGARLVTSNETEENRRWAEARIKALTGGDRISARFMRQDFFEFTPQFKLLIAGNHKPGLRSVDEAMRRRFHLIPFTVTIPPHERDLDLGEKIRTEWPAILAWMIEGCLEWQRQGLAPPAVVTAATAEYLSAEDSLGTWIDDECVRDPNAWSSTTNLYSAWKSWADRSSEHAGSMKNFTQKMEDRGFTPHRLNTGRGFNGLRLIQTNFGGSYDR